MKYRIDFISSDDKVISKMASRKKSRNPKLLGHANPLFRKKLPVRKSNITQIMAMPSNGDRKRRRQIHSSKKMKRTRRRRQSKNETIVGSLTTMKEDEKEGMGSHDIEDMKKLGYEDMSEIINKKMRKKKVDSKELKEGDERLDEIEYLNILVL